MAKRSQVLPTSRAPRRACRSSAAAWSPLNIRAPRRPPSGSSSASASLHRPSRPDLLYRPRLLLRADADPHLGRYRGAQRLRGRRRRPPRDELPVLHLLRDDKRRATSSTCPSTAPRPTRSSRSSAVSTPIAWPAPCSTVTPSKCSCGARTMASPACPRRRLDGIKVATHPACHYCKVFPDETLGNNENFMVPEDMLIPAGVVCTGAYNEKHTHCGAGSVSAS